MNTWNYEGKEGKRVVLRDDKKKKIGEILCKYQDHYYAWRTNSKAYGASSTLIDAMIQVETNLKF